MKIYRTTREPKHRLFRRCVLALLRPNTQKVPSPSLKARKGPKLCAGQWLNF
jgi:hypothetical protein